MRSAPLAGESERRIRRPSWTSPRPAPPASADPGDLLSDTFLSGSWKPDSPWYVQQGAAPAVTQRRDIHSRVGPGTWRCLIASTSATTDQQSQLRQHPSSGCNDPPSKRRSASLPHNALAGFRPGDEVAKLPEAGAPSVVASRHSTLAAGDTSGQKRDRSRRRCTKSLRSSLSSKLL